MSVDILIKNGRVIDCYNKVDEIKDVAMTNGKIVDASDLELAQQVIDATGCIVTPGLIDFHAHLNAQGSDFAVYPEATFFPTGVTTAVDAGTTGVANYEAFRARTMSQRVRIKAFLHVNPVGISTLNFPESQDPKYYSETQMITFMEKYADQLIGLKVRHSKEIVGDLGVAPIRKTIEIAEKIGCCIACHASNPPVPTKEFVKEFRPGDIYAHVFHGKGSTIIGEDGHVLPEVFGTQKNGVIFDAANGNSNFGFNTAIAALNDGFKPNIISTDLGLKTDYKLARVFSLPFVMSKYLMLGMSINDIIERVTTAPAIKLDMGKEIGSLTVGTCADVAIHRIVDKKRVFEDALNDTREGSQLFKTELTIRDGVVVYRQIDFS